jgi:hypothetical protein
MEDLASNYGRSAQGEALIQASEIGSHHHIAGPDLKPTRPIARNIAGQELRLIEHAELLTDMLLASAPSQSG